MNKDLAAAASELRGSTKPESRDIILAALRGDRGEDQRRIAEVGIEWLELLLRKNADYGSSAWQVPALAPGLDVGTAIRVRMSDKIARIARLLDPANPVEIKAETIDDTFRDLGAYCLLYLARPMKTDEEI